MSDAITVYKHDHHGQELWHYAATILSRNASTIVLEAYFNRDDHQAAYHLFKRGDRFVEYFYTDRWYNIFAMYHRDSNALEGWYCNITRPAIFESNAIRADDLALDVMVYPNGEFLVLDEDEFAALDLDSATRQAAQNALQDLLATIQAHQEPFTDMA